MTDWPVFAGLALLAVVVMLVLTRMTQRLLEEPMATAAEGTDAHPVRLTPAALAANVGASHGLMLAVLLGAAWYAEVPPAALGLVGDLTGAAPLGVGLGLGLAAANEAAERAARRLGYPADPRLRELLAPDSPAGWAVLLGFALPVVAGLEELLFRGALVGAFSVGFGASPWALAVVSSVLFGLGHGLQGPGGVVVTGAIGLVLAAAFVLTGSLAAVVIAHYLVNAVEFAAHEGPARL